jgi:REP element-mobilizing transposase RayT
MSAPRRIVPGVTYLLSRRCTGRHFLLRPSNKVNQIFKFCLAVAAEKTGVLLHNFCVLSNHYHVVATDVHGNLPTFMHWLNEYVAKCVNAELGRWEFFWAPGSYSAVALVDREDVIDKLVYVFTNPVDAGLVPEHEEWPGACSLVADIDGEPHVVHRPKGFFREKGPVPETEILQMVSPPVFEGVRSECLASVGARILEREQEVQRQAQQQGWRFLGVRKVLAQSPFSRPSTSEPRRGLNPRVASRDKWQRIEALQRLKDFLETYRVALKRFVDGDRATVFPFGTYGMRVRFGVLCSGP